MSTDFSDYPRLEDCATSGLTTRVANLNDFTQLQPLFMANCDKMKFSWARYFVAIV